MRKVHIHAIAVVGHEGATRATLLPVRSQHEVLHEQLPTAVEQVGERAAALGRFENIVLVDVNPRQRTALAGDLVAQACQFLFARQQRLALDNPFVPGCGTVVFDAFLEKLRGVGHGYSHRDRGRRWLVVAAAPR